MTKNEPRRVDTRGLKCPWPVLRAARAMREDGEILLLADDPVALVDVPVLARANGWALDVQEHADHAEYHLRQAEDFDGR